MNPQNYEIMQIKGIDQKRDGNYTIQNINLFLLKSEFISILGTAGAGKSILFNILKGEEQQYDGKIIFENQLFKPKNIEESQLAGIYSIGSHSNLIGSMSVAENMFLIKGNQRQLALVNNKLISQKTGSVLLEYGLDIEPDTLIHNFSDTMQCIIQLVKLINMGAKIILLLDTFNAASKQESNIVREIFKKAKKKKISIIYFSNRYIKILKKSSRLFIFKDGRLVRTLYRDSYEKNELNTYMLGFNLVDQKTNNEKNRGKEVLRVTNLSGGPIKNFNFNTYAHETLGLIAEEHSTVELLTKVLLNFNNYQGSMHIDSEQVTIKNIVDAFKNGLSLFPINSKVALFNDLSPIDNITISLWNRMCVIPGIISTRIYKIISSQINALSEDKINLTNIYKLGHKDRMDLIISKFLCYPYKIVIFCQPSLNYDILEMYKIRDLINKLKDEHCSIIVISTDLIEAKTLCDRIIMLDSNRD